MFQYSNSILLEFVFKATHTQNLSRTEGKLQIEN
jgi:hypothetical protein